MVEITRLGAGDEGHPGGPEKVLYDSRTRAAVLVKALESERDWILPYARRIENQS